MECATMLRHRAINEMLDYLKFWLAKPFKNKIHMKCVSQNFHNYKILNINHWRMKMQILNVCTFLSNNNKFRVVQYSIYKSKIYIYVYYVQK